jgi:hypothetical protein
MLWNVRLTVPMLWFEYEIPTDLCVESLVLSWVPILGAGGNFRRLSLPGGRGSLGVCLRGYLVHGSFLSPPLLSAHHEVKNFATTMMGFWNHKPKYIALPVNCFSQVFVTAMKKLTNTAYIGSTFLKNNMIINISRVINKFILFDQWYTDKPAPKNKKRSKIK